jgi:5'-3' exonuclease
MKVSDDYELEWKAADTDKLVKMLVEEHDFSKERVMKTVDELNEDKKEKMQKGLDAYI